MRMTLFNGGLGNQIFQYIFARYIEITTGETCFLEDSYFDKIQQLQEHDFSLGISTAHNGFQIERVFPNTKPHLLSKEFTSDVWEYMLCRQAEGISIPQQLADSGVQLTVVQETGDVLYKGNVLQSPPNEFCKEVALVTGDVYYSGYWINKGWLDAIKETMLYEFQFPPILKGKNLQYQKEINQTNSVSIHVRRGDFIILGIAISNDWYESAVTKIKQAIEKPVFFVFSDDIHWCKENMNVLGLEKTKDQVVFVEGNSDGENNYIDMQLMSMCKHMIICNSSFSYFPALINQNKDRIIANPTTRQV